VISTDSFLRRRDLAEAIGAALTTKAAGHAHRKAAAAATLLGHRVDRAPLASPVRPFCGTWAGMTAANIDVAWRAHVRGGGSTRSGPPTRVRTRSP